MTYNIMKGIGWMYLCDMKVGNKAIVKKIVANDNIKRRLLDIGLIEGTNVECVLKSPFNDPTAYLIRGAIIAIRKEDCNKIEVDII